MFTKEPAEGEEAPEPTEEEAEQGPEPLSTLDKDAEVEAGEAWTPLFSSTNSGVKNQVAHPGYCPARPRLSHAVLHIWQAVGFLYYTLLMPV